MSNRRASAPVLGAGQRQKSLLLTVLIRFIRVLVEDCDMLSQLTLTDCQRNVGVVSARVKMIFPIDAQNV